MKKNIVLAILSVCFLTGSPLYACDAGTARRWMENVDHELNELKGSAVQLAWDPVIDDASYLVTIKTTLETIFQKSTKMAQMSFPANLLAPNTTYFVQIQAQKIHGDPLFKNETYYSVSVNTSADLGFAVE